MQPIHFLHASTHLIASAVAQQAALSAEFPDVQGSKAAWAAATFSSAVICFGGETGAETGTGGGVGAETGAGGAGTGALWPAAQVGPFQESGNVEPSVGLQVQPIPSAL